ncbi:ADP-ribose pyrophosphatase YjhB (NUDIX family) [Variovorax boronicumulans]|uniref:NUDIX hydrolase n=1 Tax=Variovorax boronicumulans TaxID=436515 RepID=UPI002473D62B|nr:NUDIX hydrolase [Variovorax boronicumulans]MDH6168890.1 ADP-ribose pyrophosphatase YjhB (NUDIX family) [Variovorax boronicumulans]
MAKRWKPNVTVAAVIEQDGRLLLVEEHTPDGLMLNTPAGHLDPGESPAEGCIRETLEETAHHFTPTALIGIYMARSRPQAERGEDVTYMRFAFTGVLGAREEGRALDEGIVRTLWMTPDEIRASVVRHRSPLLLQCVDDYLAGQRHPLDLIHVDESVKTPPVKR